MEVRPCTDQDMGNLLTRWPLSGAVHRAHMAAQTAERVTFLVAWEGEEPVGCAVVQWHGCVGQHAHTGYPQAVEINHLHVRDQWRGNGAGSQLIRFAEDLMLERGVTVAALGVSDDNPQAAGLYRRLGYVPTDVWDVAEYDWVDDSGKTYHAVERNQLLVSVQDFELTNVMLRLQRSDGPSWQVRRGHPSTELLSTCDRGAETTRSPSVGTSRSGQSHIRRVIAGVVLLWAFALLTLIVARPWFWDDYVAGYQAGAGVQTDQVTQVCDAAAMNRLGHFTGDPGSNASASYNDEYFSFMKGCRDRSLDRGFHLTRTFLGSHAVALMLHTNSGD